MISLWFLYDFLMISICFPSDFHMIARFPYDFHSRYPSQNLQIRFQTQGAKTSSCIGGGASWLGQRATATSTGAGSSFLSAGHSILTGKDNLMHSYCNEKSGMCWWEVIIQSHLTFTVYLSQAGPYLPHFLLSQSVFLFNFLYIQVTKNNMWNHLQLHVFYCKKSLFLRLLPSKFADFGGKTWSTTWPSQNKPTFRWETWKVFLGLMTWIMEF